MPKSIIDSKVSLNAIRRANQRRRGKTTSTSTMSSGSKGEIHVKFSTGFGVKEITLTRDQINSAYSKAFHKNVKKL